ncbi:MAG: tape measure protein [Phascolarctobacterium sp.]|nr:tape measure protein [Phascolarctobacterium sp.]
MAEVARLSVVIGARINDFNKKIGEVQKNLRAKLGKVGFEFSKGSLNVLAGMAAGMTALGAAAVRSAAQMEQNRVAFTTLLRSAEKAKRFLAAMEKFAATTPFELPGVLAASKRLLAFGFTAEQVLPILRAVGDSAAALGLGEDGIQRMTLAIGQMQAKGKIQAQEMLQLAEAGVPAWELLAKAIGVDIPTAMKMAEEGQISAAQGIQAIVAGMNAKFSGMMEAQAQTINGIMSNIRDSVGQTMTAIGDDIVRGLNLKEHFKGMQDWLGNFAQAVKSYGIGETLRTMIPPGLTASIGALGGMIMATAVPALAHFALGLIKLKTAAGIALGWWGLIGAAVGAAAISLWQNWEWVVAKWEYAWASMDYVVNDAVGSIQSKVASMVQNIASGLRKLMGFFGQTSDIADDMDAWAEKTKKAANAAIDAAKARKELAASKKIEFKFEMPDFSFQSADVNDLGLTSLGTYTEKAKQAKEKTAQLSEEVRNAKESFKTFFDDLLSYGSSFAESFNTLIGNLANNMVSQLTGRWAETLAMGLFGSGKQEETTATPTVEGDGANGMFADLSNSITAASVAADGMAKGLGNTSGVLGTTTGLLGTYNAIESLITGTTKPAETAASVSVTGALGALSASAIAASIALKSISASSGGFGSLIFRAKGGFVKAATGGAIYGAGTATSDSIPAMLSNGEYVIKAAAVKRLGVPFLDALNQGRTPGYSVGGLVHANANNGGNGGSAVVKQGGSVTFSINALDAESFVDYLRNRGGAEAIRQMIFDDNRDFAGMAGVW